MASRRALTRPLRSLVIAARSGAATTASNHAARAFTTSACQAKEIAGNAGELPNMRHAPRSAPQGKLHAPIVNPTGTPSSSYLVYRCECNADTRASDVHQEKAESLHAYGQYLLSCLPKYIQQYSPQTSALNVSTLGRD